MRPNLSHSFLEQHWITFMLHYNSGLPYSLYLGNRKTTDLQCLEKKQLYFRSSILIWEDDIALLCFQLCLKAIIRELGGGAAPVFCRSVGMMCLTILHQCQWGWGISFSLFVQRKTECFGNYHNKNIRYSYSHHLFSALILSSCARFILVLGISYKVYNGCERRNAGVFNNVYWNKFE